MASMQWLTRSALSLAIVLGVGWLGSIVWQMSTSPPACSNAYSRAALNNLPWVLSAPNESCTGDECNPANVGAYQKKVDDLKVWAKKLPEGCAKYAYLNWAWFVGLGLPDALKKWNEDQKVAVIAAGMPKP